MAIFFNDPVPRKKRINVRRPCPFLTCLPKILLDTFTYSYCELYIFMSKTHSNKVSPKFSKKELKKFLNLYRILFFKKITIPIFIDFFETLQ